MDFSFQAKEFEHLKNLLPKWILKKDSWTENQNLTSIAIGRELQIDDFHLEALKRYVQTYKKSVRREMYQKDIAGLEKKLQTSMQKAMTGQLQSLKIKL